MITTITSDSQNISTIDALDELHSGKAHKDAHKLFK